MKVNFSGNNYKFITDNSQEISRDGAFLITSHNKKYLKKVEENGVAIFLHPQDLFKEWNLEKVKIIGITGTNGKTTTSNIIAHILKSLGQKVAVSGTEGVFLHSQKEVKQIAPRTHTTPEILTTLNNLKMAKDDGAEFFVMEVSSHGIFQKRIEGIEFACKIFTNLSQDHLDFHKTMEEYARVKSSFFNDENNKVVNLDDQWIKYNPKNTLTYSLEKDADLRADNFSFGKGIKAEIFYQNKKYFLESPLLGKFNLYNILASVGTVIQMGNFRIESILESLKDFYGVVGRMEVLYQKNGIEVFSDYAHTPDAIEKVLTSLDKRKKIITIIGAGGDRDKSKRPLMAKMACQNSDYVFLTSDNPRSENPKDILKDMEKQIKDNFSNYKMIENRSKAIVEALKMASEAIESGEMVSIAILGKGDENYMEIKGVKYPYSDKEEVQKFFNY